MTMSFFPDSALVQLEFDKIKGLLGNFARTAYAKTTAAELSVATSEETINEQLRRVSEFKILTQSGQYFPNEYVQDLTKELKLLGIEGAALSGLEVCELRKLADAIRQIFRWFDDERATTYPSLAGIIRGTRFEKNIVGCIDQIVDPSGSVLDDASKLLQRIRSDLFKKRIELRRLFERIISKLGRSGFVADIEEGFLNGRRVVAVFSEHKRQVKGILHGESDTRKTSYIEPEETISLNNEIFSLEQEERREEYRILRDLTARLSVYAPLLETYHQIRGEYDFIAAKAKLALEMQGNLPQIVNASTFHLIDALHPLLCLYNQKNGKPTVPVTLELGDKNRILVISGPNAGGKTVTMKTVGLLQLMVQAGLLVPVHPDSKFGIFHQIMIHIGDTQSLEFELSTYSSHLKHLKHFIEHANERALFFIDELGSGSDPNLGGAFAEVILQELLDKGAFGIVTTHYINLKVMANKTPGIQNAAMAFDEQKLLPLYRLMVGKPGSSYTFSIASRIGLNPALVERARALVDEGQIRLEKLLNKTEQELHILENSKRELNQLIRENENLRKEMQKVVQKERHAQQIEILRHQNQISQERITYLKDMERKLKQIVVEWKKSEDKTELIKHMRQLLFKQKESQKAQKIQKSFDLSYTVVDRVARQGDKVKMKKNHQVGIVKEVRGKKAVVQLGMVPITVEIKDLTVVIDRSKPEAIN